jgi:predicted dehydrogenase
MSNHFLELLFNSLLATISPLQSVTDYCVPAAVDEVDKGNKKVEQICSDRIGKLRRVDMKSLLIGFGSIGRRHLRELSSRSQEVVVYDLRNNFPEIIEEVGNAHFYFDWETLSESHKRFDFAVVSTWGPNHLQQLRNVQDLGVKSVLIEKPLAASLRDIEEIANIAKSRGIRLFENFHFRYSYFKTAIQELEEQFNLGKLIQFNISGGAKCVATTGIHYLDLCEWILEKRPVSVMSDLSYSYINPRSSNLRIYGGLAKWDYPSGASLTMNFTNESYADATVEIVWRNAKAIFEGNTLTLFGPEDFPNFDPKTTALVKPFTRKLCFMDAVHGDSTNDGMTNLYDSFFNLNEDFRNVQPGSSTKDLIAALIASESKAKMLLEENINFFYETQWEIS